MASIIEMPKLSDTMTTGKIVSWIKKEGDAVAAGEAIAEVETDKATMELEVFDAGALLKILAPAGSAVPIGGPLAIVGKPGENIDDLLNKTQSGTAKPAPKPEAKSTESAPALASASASEPAPSAEDRRIRVSPVAQRMAAEHNVDLAHINGSGPAGRIVKRDIESYLAQAPAAAQVPATRQMALTPSKGLLFEDFPLNTIRSVIARRLPESLGPVPHFYLETDVNIERSLAFKNDLQALAGEDVKITLTDILVKACAVALQRHPQVNSQFGGAYIRRFYAANIGLAVAGEDALMVPVIHSCEAKSVGQIARERLRLVEKAREGRLTPNELSGGTFTISNLGMMGITRFSAVINPPQAAILAVGAIRVEPVIQDNQIVPGKRMALTISCDHRVFDGAEGAQFLATLKSILENPLTLHL
ncbi:MAG: dihydrolipoamide acetyltransferase family protein [Candidatus Omnitrophota bacterium]